jgi:D-sedoheptulose 7-phosphate isomerase
MSTILNTNCLKTSEVLHEFSVTASKSFLLASELIVNCFINGGKLLICGNGGSAADSQHLATEFVSSFNRHLSRKGLPAIALTTDTSVITAFANDFGFEGVFARQIEALGSEGDVLLLLSTSGNSQNCIRAVEQSRKMQMSSISLSGSGGVISELSDVAIKVPSTDTQIVQQCHIVAYHSLVQTVELALFS